jgi:hypothetical protein
MLLRKNSSTPLTTDDMDNNLHELSLRVLPSGNQSVGGVKTFTKNPDVPTLHSTDYSNNIIQLSFIKDINSVDTVISNSLPIMTSNPDNMKYWIINDLKKTTLMWNGHSWTDILFPSIMISSINGVFCKFNNKAMFIGDNSSISNKTNFFVPFAQDPEIDTIYIGKNNYFAKKIDGTVWAVGNNWSGQLGLGDTNNRTVLTQMDISFNNIIDISVAANSTIFTKSDGTVWAVGDNWSGQLGTGTDTNQYTTPIQLDSSLAGSRFKLYDYVLYVEKPDGTVWGCSKYGNDNGELTITGSFATLQLLPAIPSIDNVYYSNNIGNSSFVFIEKADGTVWRCGINWAGQLGTGDWNDYTTLIQLDTSFDNPNKIAVGGYSSIIEKSDGTVWATGYNTSGQLGLGDKANRNVFTQIPGILNPLNIVCTAHDLFIEKSDGTVWSVGEILGVGILTPIL